MEARGVLLALGQPYNYPSASELTLKYIEKMDRYQITAEHKPYLYFLRCIVYQAKTPPHVEHYFQLYHFNIWLEYCPLLLFDISKRKTNKQVLLFNACSKMVLVTSPKTCSAPPPHPHPHPHPPSPYINTIYKYSSCIHEHCQEETINLSKNIIVSKLILEEYENHVICNNQFAFCVLTTLFKLQYKFPQVFHTQTFCFRWYDFDILQINIILRQISALKCLDGANIFLNDKIFIP